VKNDYNLTETSGMMISDSLCEIFQMIMNDIYGMKGKILSWGKGNTNNINGLLLTRQKKEVRSNQRTSYKNVSLLLRLLLLKYYRDRVDFIFLYILCF
jgi:hypothetical protein